MQRRIEASDRAALWLERIVWNAAAAAALAVMILVLLGSLRWLDEVVPAAALAETPAVPAAAVAETPAVSAAAAHDDIAPAPAGSSRPSG